MQNSPKKTYVKPTITTHGNVEELTLKRYGAGDGFLLNGHAGTGSSNAS